MFRLPAFLALLLGLAAVLPAQLNPGDYLAPMTTGSAVVSITPGGAVQTLFTVPFSPTAVTMAPDNHDLAVLGTTPSFGGILAIVTPTGTVTTLAQYTSYIYENMAVDATGTFVMPLGAGGIQVLRIDRFGGMTTLVPSPPVGKGKPRGIAVDINTGAYFVGEIPNLYRIARDGSSKLIHNNVLINNGIDMVSDARTGEVVISQQTSLVSVDPVSGIMTTLQGGFSNNACFPGLAYDRARDSWVMAGGCLNTNMFLYRVARGGGLNTVTPLAGAVDVEVYGSLNIIAATDPTPGATLNLRFCEPSSAGDLYLAAAAFSTFPGIPTPAGVVDLTPDVLFALSQAAPFLFVNFAGVLDAKGAAPASVVVPPVPTLKGLRFFVAFVTVRGSAIRTIANTQGFTIQ